MKRGDTVTIYEDPYTMQRVEGEAKLIRRLSKSADDERWMVEFTDEPGRQYPRFISARARGERD